MSSSSLSKDSLNTLSTLSAGGQTYHYYSLPKAAETLGDLNRLPFSLKRSDVVDRAVDTQAHGNGRDHDGSHVYIRFQPSHSAHDHQDG